MSKAPNQVRTQTISTAPPSYVSAAQQNLLATAQNLTNQFTSQAPNYALAGFTPDQQMAFDLARYQAQNAFANSPTIDVQNWGLPVTTGPAAQASSAPINMASV